MRTILSIICILALLAPATAQQNTCYTNEYARQEMEKAPLLKEITTQVEKFTQQKIREKEARRGGQGIFDKLITIPVVVHILYHTPSQNIPVERVHQQLEALNLAFRRQNADTVNTPQRFRHLAGDAGIEFKLAISDPQKRATSGIIRKYTPIKQWSVDDDKMKFSEQMGDDAWDADNYLNIWVCNIGGAAGYSSFPGGPKEKDGVVINFYAFGYTSSNGYNLGKSTVHEVGHWLNLRHIWGDDYCGDDLVADTPPQHYFTMGCPSGVRPSCDNKPDGDMYMNYMDLTQDPCTNMFTHGQIERMRALFEHNGVRNSILTSYAFNPPLFSEAPIDEGAPQWLHAQVFPNPASTSLKIDLAYDVRWVGKTLSINNMAGQKVMDFVVTGKVTTVGIARLSSGYYFITGKKEDGSILRQKFVKD